LAPAIAALIGISVTELWRGRAHLSCRVTLTVMSAVTGVWAFILLDRTPDWFPALRWVILVGSVIVAALLVVGVHRFGRAPAVLALAAMLFAVGASAAYTVETVAKAHNGPMATSGPGRNTGPGGSGGPGRGWNSETQNVALEQLVRESDGIRWAAASVGSFSVSDLELKTGTSLMAIGGFSGSDNSPTLAQFQEYVARGDVRYFIVSMHGPGGGHGRDDNGAAHQIATWVEKNFAYSNVGGAKVYDLAAPIHT
jgi:hypothetical protein